MTATSNCLRTYWIIPKTLAFIFADLFAPTVGGTAAFEFKAVSSPIGGAETGVEGFVEAHELRMFLAWPVIVLDSIQSVQTQDGYIEQLCRR